MPNIQPTQPINIPSELEDLTLYKYHSNGILNLALDRLSEIYSGKIEIVDPNNPFMYLLETNCLNTAFAIQEYTLLTRKLYPRLANTENDLYLHMSDKDYLGRFSEPSYANVSFNILFNDFKNKAEYVPDQKEYVLKLPRHLKLSVDEYIFTLTSAIVIRLTETEVIDVKFENQDFNNIFPIETNFINFNLSKANQEETYLNFDLQLPEVDIEVTEIPVEKSKLFRGTLGFSNTRQFYFFRAFYLENSVWKEMIVTHTEQVYDIYTPTCIVKVINDSRTVQYYIPPVYVNTSRIGTKVKFLIYTTNGYINVNFNDYVIANFSTEYNPVFPEIELDRFTEPLQLIPKVVYIKETVIGGKDSVDFLTLKQSVLDNSIGDRKLPITMKQLEFEGMQNNFRVLKTVDILSKRIFLLECLIPRTFDRYGISSFNLDIVEYQTSLRNLSTGKNSVRKVRPDAVVIPEHTLFRYTEEGLELLDEIEHRQLTSLSGQQLITEVNNNSYFSTYYHNVLSITNNQTELRAYDINNSKIKRVNFQEFNSTARVGINTINSQIYRSAKGFTIDIMSNLKKYVGTINETNVKPYLVYRDNDESMFFLESRLFTMIDVNPVYRLELDTEFFIDRDNKLHVTNFRDNNNQLTTVALDLNSKLELIYISNVVDFNYQRSRLDDYISASYLGIGHSAVTLEELVVEFGVWLEYLYTRVHSSTGLFEYEVHTEDVPLRYTSTVYGPDNAILHRIGDVVLNPSPIPGMPPEIVLAFRRGEVKLDELGNPIPIHRLDVERYLNLMVIDYKTTLSNTPIVKDYRKFLKTFITERVTDSAERIQNRLLDNSQAFVVVPKTLTNIQVKTSNRTVRIRSDQEFTVSVYVNSRTYEDNSTRRQITETIVNELDTYLYENTALSRTKLLNALYSSLREFVFTVSVDRFTELDEEYIETVDSNARVSIRKLLTQEASGYGLRDSVNVNFFLVENS